MDWRSEEGRALLWQAYPAGFLAARGVATVSVYKIEKWCRLPDPPPVSP